MSGIQVMEQRRIAKNRLQHIPYNFLKKTVNYGYRPIKALFYSLKKILLFGVLYHILDLFDYFYSGNKLEINSETLRNGVSNFVNRIYYSGYTFTTTGYGDIVTNNWLTKILAIYEAILGVSVLALFIMALTRRYLKN